MAIQIGIRELKNQTSKIVRAVREDSAEYIITPYGEPVALLRPLTDKDKQEQRQEKATQFLSELDQLAQLVISEWQAEKTGVDLIEEQRRG